MAEAITPPITYPFHPVEQREVQKNFTYHPLKAGQKEKYGRLRGLAQRLAEDIHFHCPPSRERSLALTKLEECIFWSNAAIARNE